MRTVTTDPILALRPSGIYRLDDLLQALYGEQLNADERKQIVNGYHSEQAWGRSRLGYLTGREFLAFWQRKRSKWDEYIAEKQSLHASRLGA